MFFSSRKSPSIIVSFVALAALMVAPDAYCGKEDGDEGRTPSTTTSQKPTNIIDQEKARANAGNLSILDPEVLELVFDNFGIGDLAKASVVCNYFRMCAQDTFIQRHLRLALELAPENDVTFEKLKNTPQESLHAIHTIASYFRYQKSSVVERLLEASPEQIQSIKEVAPLLFSDAGKEYEHIINLGRLLETNDKTLINCLTLLEFANGYSLGNGVGYNHKKAAKLYQIASEELEKMYATRQNKFEPIRYYRAAATHYYSAISSSSDTAEKSSLCKKSGKMYEKQIALLGEKATPQDYINAANSYDNAAFYSSDEVEISTLYNYAEELKLKAAALETSIKKARSLTDIERINSCSYYWKGYLEINDRHLSTLSQLSKEYQDRFDHYNQGIFVKNWKASADFAPLLDFLFTFSHVRKFKLSIKWDIERDLTELICRPIQFYEDLEELDISSCGLTDASMNDLRASIPHPKKLKILDVRYNNLSNQAIDKLRTHFKNLTNFRS